MSSSDFMAQRQAAFCEFLDSSFMTDVHIRSTDDSSVAVRLHSAVLAAASGFWRETLSDVNVQGEVFILITVTSDSGFWIHLDTNLLMFNLRKFL